MTNSQESPSQLEWEMNHVRVDLERITLSFRGRTVSGSKLAELLGITKPSDLPETADPPRAT